MRVAQLEEALWTDQWDPVLHRAELWVELVGLGGGSGILSVPEEVGGA